MTDYTTQIDQIRQLQNRRKSMGTFDWMQFPEGRARFAGGVRGWDELGHETFALELRGHEYFGQIDNVFHDNQNDYDIVIHAFGYGRGEDVGMPGIGDVDLLGTGVREVFTPEEEALARNLVVHLIQAGLEFEEPPFPLDPPSHFRGGITFQDGWMLIRTDRAGTAQ